MPGRYYSKEIKEEILHKIKNEGLTGAEASKLYGINVKNIYRWLAQGITGKSNQIEINRLKRENRVLKELLGQLLIDKERGKKDRHG